jgi:hypothetical protein
MRQVGWTCAAHRAIEELNLVGEKMPVRKLTAREMLGGRALVMSGHSMFQQLKRLLRSSDPPDGPTGPTP